LPDPYDAGKSRCRKEFKAVLRIDPNFQLARLARVHGTYHCKGMFLMFVIHLHMEGKEMGIFDRLLGPSEVEKLKEKKDVEGLVRKLETGKPREQASAAYALGDIGDERATEPLIRLLERVETDGDVCIAGVNALGKLGNDRAVEALVRALSDTVRGRTSSIGLLELPVALAAAHALSSIGKPAVEPLINALGSELGRMRVYARRALEMIGEPVVEPLKKALTNENKYVREEAGEILKDMRVDFKPTPSTPRKRYCIKCGAEMLVEAKYCPECGSAQ